MKSTPRIILLLLMPALVIAACNSGAKDKKGSVGDLKVTLEKKKKEKQTIETEIRELEDKIAKADPASVQSRKLVAVDTVHLENFSHYIELQGKIDAEGMAYVSPSGMGGLVKAIYVKTGDRVRKGQLILKLDDAMAKQAVVAAQQQTGVLRARLAQAKTVLERYENLWKQNIGAEINVINAKADVEALQSQLNAANAQVRMAQEQANLSNVHAQISGMVDAVNVKVGEFFSPQSAANPASGIRIVNNAGMKIITNVPENYVTRVKKGGKVQVEVSETGKPPYETTISMVGGSIDPTTRSFTTEAKLPSDPILKPNQIATMRILDYETKSTIAVSVNLVQTDEGGKYVYVAQNENGKLIARKKRVNVGESYGGKIEIRAGLANGDIIITEGYQVVYDGQAITTGK
jgi:membrane fusion protein, multidrug efflux system